MNRQLDALRLADWQDQSASISDMGRKPDKKDQRRLTAIELRRQHAEIERLTAERDAALAKLAALAAQEPELFGWMVSGVPTVMRGSLAEAIQKNEAKHRIAAANRLAEVTDWSAS